MATHTKRLDLFYWITISSADNATIRLSTLHPTLRATRRISRLNGAVTIMQLAIVSPFAPILAPGREA